MRPALANSQISSIEDLRLAMIVCSEKTHLSKYSEHLHCSPHGELHGKGKMSLQ